MSRFKWEDSCGDEHVVMHDEEGPDLLEIEVHEDHVVASAMMSREQALDFYEWLGWALHP